jgi:hypothetical protein
MQNGTFHNDKVLSATHNVSVEGPFVPVIQTDATGTVTKEWNKNIVLKRSAIVNFWVEPFLTIEWVGAPVFNKNSTVTVQVRITPGDCEFWLPE